MRIFNLRFQIFNLVIFFKKNPIILDLAIYLLNYEK